MFIEVCNSDAEAAIVLRGEWHRVKFAKRTDRCSGERSLVNLWFLH